MATGLANACVRLKRDDPSLTILNLNGKWIGNEGARLLAEALLHNTHLVVLFLDCNEIFEGGARALAGSIAHHPKLSFLYLSHNPFGNSGAKALADVLKHRNRLQALKVDGCCIGDEGARAFGAALRESNSLLKLSMQHNEFGESGLIAIANSLQFNSSVQELDVRGSYDRLNCVVRDAFRTTLQDHNTTLRRLFLFGSGPEADMVDDSDAIQFFLNMNKVGRRYFGTCEIPSSAWCRVLARCSKDTKLLFTSLRTRPDLLCREEDCPSY